MIHCAEFGGRPGTSNVCARRAWNCGAPAYLRASICGVKADDTFKSPATRPSVAYRNQVYSEQGADAFISSAHRSLACEFQG